MKFAQRSSDGSAVLVDTRRRGERRLTPAQALNRRNMLWLFAVEVGLHDPVTGRVRPHSTEELAQIFGVGPRSVQLGIQRARAIRDATDRDDTEHAS